MTSKIRFPSLEWYRSCLREPLDRLMGKMEVNPVTDIEEAFLEDDLLRLEGMKNDAEACVKLFKSWKRRYEGEDDAALKQ